MTDRGAASASVLDLFSGIGGFSLAAESCGFETLAFCEIEPYPVRVLNRHWPDVPVFLDVKELTSESLADAERRRRDGWSSNADWMLADGKAGERHEGKCHNGWSGEDGRTLILTAGFPCQDISYAGKGAGLAGERSGLFYEVVRLIRELRPRYALLENVAGLLTRGLPEVLGSLAEVGFDALWACIPACAVGAPHRRDRIWILATPTSPDSAERLQRIYDRVLSGLTPFGSLNDGWPTATASDAWAPKQGRVAWTGRDGTGRVTKHALGLGHAVTLDE